MSRGLTDPEPQPEDANLPTVQQLNDAMKEAYDQIYIMALRIETIEDLLRNKLDQALPEVKKEKKKWTKGL